MRVEIIHKELSYAVRGVLFEVHNQLGPGFFHHVYRRAAMIELRKQEIGFKYVKKMPVYFHNTFLGHQESRLIFVENCIFLAIVAVQAVDEAMKSQLRQKMRRQNVNLGILANFNSTKLDIQFVKKEYNE